VQWGYVLQISDALPMHCWQVAVGPLPVQDAAIQACSVSKLCYQLCCIGFPPCCCHLLDLTLFAGRTKQPPEQQQQQQPRKHEQQAAPADKGLGTGSRAVHGTTAAAAAAAASNHHHPAASGNHSHTSHDAAGQQQQHGREEAASRLHIKVGKSQEFKLLGCALKLLIY
jgi:hypothetical protein